MKAWQRKIREKEAQKDPRPVVGLEKRDSCRNLLRKGEGTDSEIRVARNNGINERSFGLILDGELAGVGLFGKTGGTETAKSVCGERGRSSL